MDPWLEDDIKELLAKPCLAVSSMIGRRLDNRLRLGQEMDERALTESLVDAFDTASELTAWGTVAGLLRDHNIYLSTSVRKSTAEHRTGADIGIMVSRSVHSTPTSSRARYAVLIQCKRVSHDGSVGDFYHVVKSTGRTQCSLLLDVTPASFYFLYVAPSLVQTYCTIEPMAFLRGSPGCSSPVWNMGCFGFDQQAFPFLSADQKAEVTGVLVVPALAVHAQQAKGRSASLAELLPNALPFWYWFAELLVPGFVGDYRENVLATATNVRTNETLEVAETGVRFALELSLGNG